MVYTVAALPFESLPIAEFIGLTRLFIQAVIVALTTLAPPMVSVAISISKVEAMIDSVVRLSLCSNSIFVFLIRNQIRERDRLRRV
jgi:hypothetical protein